MDQHHAWLARVCIIVSTLFASALRAQELSPDGAAEFALGLGYANVSLGSKSSIDSEGAFHFEPSLVFSPIQQLPQLRLGTDVGVTMVLDNSTRTIISSGGTTIFRGSSDVPLWLLEPELRLSWRQYLGGDHIWFVEPGVGGGWAFGFLDLDSDDGSSYSKNDSTLFGRVFLRAGAKVQGGTFGFEASYLAGSNLDFGGDASGDLNEFYIGIFGALAF